MGKPRKTHRKKKFNYDKNRKRAWKKSKKLPVVRCEQMREAWDEKKSVKRNLSNMGLSADPNKTIPIPKAKDLLGGKIGLLEEVSMAEFKQMRKGSKTHKVVEELEAEANAPQPRRVKLSEPEIRYCIYMMETYGEDYKAMARDEKNYYQETPKQIRRKINTFKSIPSQYKKYLEQKSSKDMDTSL